LLLAVHFIHFVVHIKMPELVRVSQRGNSLAQRNMEFIKRFGIYRINWIGKANTLNKSGAKLV